MLSECSCSHPTCLSIFLLGLSQPQDTDTLWEYPYFTPEGTVDIILVLDLVHPHTYLVIAIEDQALVRLHGAKAKTETQNTIFRQGMGNRSYHAGASASSLICHSLGSTLACLDVKCLLSPFNHLFLLCRFMI